MSINHLDFATPEVPALEFDDSGMPLLTGRGSELWAHLVDGVNIQTDGGGWDLPAALFTASAPTVTAAMVSFEITGDVDSPAEAPVAFAYSTGFLGHVHEHTLQELWGSDLAAASAILVGREIWLTPFPGLTIPSGAWREGREKLDGKAKKKAKKKAKGEREQPAATDRLECREWTVVTSAGTSFTRWYVRTGKRRSTYLLTTEEPSYPATVLHRMYGRTVAPRLDCPSMSVPEVLALTAAFHALLWLSKGFEESVPVADKVSMKLDMVAGAWLGYTLEDDALMDEARSIADLPERRAAVASIVTRLYEAATDPGWVRVWQDSDGEESRFLLLPGNEVPPHEHAEWAGEELLALLAGAYYQPYAEALGGLAADAGEVACAQVRERLTVSGLPIPDGLFPQREPAGTG
jgi:hypothetical protein